MIVAPSSLSIKASWQLVRQDKTLLRFMEDEQIARLYLQGRIVDIGGGADFDYTKLIQIDGNLDSINISAAVNPTIVADLNEVLPIADESYDKLICFNTLEHIHEERRITRELLRGGAIRCDRPFPVPTTRPLW